MLLDMTQEDLATAAELSQTTIEGFEAERSKPHRATIKSIVRALNARGVTFKRDENGQLIVAHDPNHAASPPPTSSANKTPHRSSSN